MVIPTAKPRTRTFNVRSLVTAIAGVERKYPSYRFSRRNFLERQSVAVTGVAIPTLTFSSPISFPGGTVGVVYAGLLYQAVGGVDPYTYAVTAGILPPGLVLNPLTGELAGTPTLAGSYPFTVTASGSFGTGTKAGTVVIS